MNARTNRSTYIGGGDMAVLMGASRYRTERYVWLHKTKGVETPQNQRMAIGLMAEPLLREIAAADGYGVVAGDDVPVVKGVLGGTVDGFLLVPLGREGHATVWEGKTINAAVPEHPRREWTIQVQHYMGLVDADTAVITALGARWEHRHYIVHRDDALIAHMRDLAEAWWADHVARGIEPAPQAADLPNLLTGLERDDEVAIHEAVMGAWFDARAARMLAEDVEKAAAATLAAAMDGAMRATSSAGTVRVIRATRTGIDLTRLREELPQVAAAYTRTTKSAAYFQAAPTKEIT